LILCGGRLRRQWKKDMTKKKREAIKKRNNDSRGEKRELGDFQKQRGRGRF